MGIDARLRLESGEVLGEVIDPQMVLSRATEQAFAETRLLKYLDRWGDTVFNKAQADDLLADIIDVKDANPGTPLFRFLSDLEPLVTRLSREAHAYLWFIGD